jgi:hypothetical protein
MNRTLIHDTAFALHGASLRGFERCGFEDGWARLAARSGTLVSAPQQALFPFKLLNLSVNARLPKGAKLSAEIRTARKGRWSPWRVIGQLESGFGSSAKPGGPVDVDTLVLDEAADSFQYRLVGEGKGILITLVAVAYSDGKALSPGGKKPAGRALLLDVPVRSQMVEMEAIRRDVCSPASIGMALDYWGADAPPTAVLAAAVRDRTAGIFGNWFLNTAYAGRQIDAFISRLGSLEELERELAAGRPVVCTIGFEPGELKGSPIPRTKGHLVLVRGIDERGRIIVNDPAAADESSVRRVYDRGQFARAWLQRKGGVCYRFSTRFPKELSVAAPWTDLRASPVDSKHSRDKVQESTLLLGERVLCLGGRGDWAHVRALDQRRDGRPYEGWVRAEALARLEDPPDAVVLTKIAPGKLGGRPLPLPAGALVRRLGKDRSLLPGDRAVKVPAASLSPLRPLSGGAARRRILATARQFLGEPYFWGGLQSRTFGRGLDCSGLVTVAYRSAGLRPPRNAHDQWVESIPVRRPAQGDLVFLSEPGKPELVTHVMIWAGGGRVIEAEGSSDRVRTVRFEGRVEPGRTVYFGTYLR